MTTNAEHYLTGSKHVINPTHSIAIRYHLFQDDQQDEALTIGTHCYIVLNDYRHQTYLVSAIILGVDKANRQYDVRRMNDNEEETYYWHQIVVAYHKGYHSIDIEQHKQRIISIRNTEQKEVEQTVKESKKSKNNKNNKNQNTKRKRKDHTQSHDDAQPKKKRKLNDSTATNINTNDNHNSNKEIYTVAQPYFPIPHPYFRQNALMKWRCKDRSDWEVGRIVDFNMDSDTIYIQNTYRCGTKDDELRDAIEVKWEAFAEKTDAVFIADMYLYQLKQPILYWWDRPGCGSICNDTIEALDYGASKDLIYGITGLSKKILKRKQWHDGNLKWCDPVGICEHTFANKVMMSKYITRNFKTVKSVQNKGITAASEAKLFDTIVIGAGMAGLTARWALHRIESEYKLNILEAQEDIGGRLKRHTFPSKRVCDPLEIGTYDVPEVSVELGAAFLSGSGKDNRFWSWLQQHGKHVCADWGGYNNGWWNGDSFIDSNKGEFVSNTIIERIKTICDDIQTLCCKLLMPLDDMSVIDGLEYLKSRIPRDQLFGIEGTQCNETYFYSIYDKYKILSANWVGPQGLWQQQQTVELQNLDFEALYVFLRNVFGSHRGKKWLVATEKLIMDYYGDNTNIKTENFDVESVYRIRSMHRMETEDMDDSEATESEADHSMTLSPSPRDIMKHTLPANVDWDNIVRYDVSDYGQHIPFKYKFGYRDILVRDIIHPPIEEEAAELQKTSGLSDLDYARFKDALEHLADCNLFSYHLYFLRCSEEWKRNTKVKQLLIKFREDLDIFDGIIADFKDILMGKELSEKKEEHHTYHNRKNMEMNKERKSSPLHNKHKWNETNGRGVLSIPLSHMIHPTKKNEEDEENEDDDDINDNKDETRKKKQKKQKRRENDWIEDETDKEVQQTQFESALSLNPNAEIVGDGFVVNGYSQVLEPFKVDIQNQNLIHMNHRVTSIERIKMGTMEISEIRGIDLSCGKPFCFLARFVVCSVPLGVLKLSLKDKKEGCYNGGIQFKPPLSAEKQEAIEAMGMGVENKVYLRFTKCFWPRDKPYFQSIQHPEYRFINLSYFGFKLPPNTNVLCTMIPPTVGKKWKVRNPAQELRIVWDVLRVLNEMFKARDCGDHKTEEVEDTMMNGHKDEDVEMKMNEANDIKHQYTDDRMHQNGFDDVVCDVTDQTQRVCKLEHSTANRNEIAVLLSLLVDYKVTDWEHNLFTRGSYSFLPKGAIYTHCKSLQKYEGDGIYFCGEATSIEGFECVDGAHETGFAVAKQIHKQLQEIYLKRKH